MSKPILFYPRPVVERAGASVVSQAGAVLLTDLVSRQRIDRRLSAALQTWRPTSGGA